jgi:hypothetical protein
MRSLILMRKHMSRLIRVAREPLSTARELAHEFFGVLGFARAVALDEGEHVAGGHGAMGEGLAVATGGGTSA